MEIIVEPSLSLRGEYEGAELGDARRTKRLVEMVEGIMRQPDASFPDLFPDAAELEGAYRFIRNEKIKDEALWEPHKEKTTERAIRAGAVVVAHDTTQCNFGKKPRAGLGMVGQGKSYGHYSHVSLVSERGGERMPLGVAAIQNYSRDGKQKRRGKKATHKDHQNDPSNEGRRWFAAVEKAEEALQGCSEIIHVMDREADSYSIFSNMTEHDYGFVIRQCYDRCTLDDEYGKIKKALAAAPVHTGEREVTLGKRDMSSMPSNRKRYPPRKPRLASLAVSAAQVTIARPTSASRSEPPSLRLNAVRVFEPNPPDDEPRVEWYLLTTEPIDTVEQIWAIVDLYRQRWIIEEYFKALKTGCAYEKRQFETEASLLRVMALFVPMAWWLLMLRTVARTAPELPATTVLSTTQLYCLRQCLCDIKVELPDKPLVTDVLHGIARLGGHIPYNGEPGWIVLRRGLNKLMLLERGYLLAMNAQSNMPRDDILKSQ